MKLKNSNTPENVKIFFSGIECRNQSKSDYSYSIVPLGCGEELTRERIASAFEISTSKENFQLAFLQAVSGSGNELRRIGTLHSSALLSLLCFYSVSEDNPLTIKIGNTTIVFTNVWFECKNYVVDKNDNPSNIDVVLCSDDKKVMLFLESKFTEPLSRGSLSKLNPKYEPLLEKVGYYSNRCKNVNGRDYVMYWGGIKQMIAHLLGIKTGPVEKGQKGYREAYENAEKYYLGSILYKPSECFFDTKECNFINAYFSFFEECMNKIVGETEYRKTDKGKDIVLLTQPLTYQDVFNTGKFKLDKMVRDFYKL